MTNENVEELPPAEQPPTDDPWVIVTPMAGPESKQGVSPEETPRPRRVFPCPKCGAYWQCEHELNAD